MVYSDINGGSTLGANNVKAKLLAAIHDTAVGGHFGIQACYLKAKTLFYWYVMKADIQEFISSCEICKKCKTETVPYHGLLQPLGP